MNSYVQTVPVSGLGEGPHWNASKRDFAVYVDISGQLVHRYVPDTGEHTQVRIDEERVSLIVPVEGQDNKYVVGVGRTLQIMDWDGKSTTPTSLTSMFSVEPDRPANRFNDGKCDARGRLWAGTIDDNGTSANLYRVTNTIQTVQTNIGTSNGIAWNRDNTLMYYIDTATRKVDVFDFDLEQGTIRNRRTVYDYNAVGERGSPDGMNIDADGNLWVACWGGSQIIKVNPNTGQKLTSIDLPAMNITSMDFGGPNLDVMYITCAIDGMNDSERRQYPAAGSLLKITNTGVRGLPANKFRI